MPTSADKINDAERRGVIDHDTALLYLLYLAFDHPDLPDDYAGGDGGLRVEGTAILAEAAARREQMSPDVRVRIEPFFRRPSDPSSFWYDRMERLVGARVGQRQVAGPLIAQGLSWKSVDTPQVRVWYPSESIDDRDLAERLAAEVTSSGMWEAERDAMLGREPCSDASLAPDHGADGKLDFYLAYQGLGLNWGGRRGQLAGNEGVAVPQAMLDGCKGWVTFVLVNRDLQWEDLQVTTAHELFHAFQFAFALSADSGWWMEASATWAEHLVYKDLNREQDWLRFGWAGTEDPLGPLDRYDYEEGWQYGAYIWPFYLSSRPGGTPQAVGELWRQVETRRAIDVMTDMADWAESWKEFALWNWNREGSPADKYRDDGERIDELTQSARSFSGENAIEVSGSPYSLDVDLPFPSMLYLEATQVHPGVKQLAFKLGSIAGQPGAALQAIVTIGREGEAGYEQRVEDWTGLTERTYCLDDEHVTNVVLVISNSAEPVVGGVDIEAMATACNRWAGTVTSEWSQVVAGPGYAEDIHGSLTAQVIWELDPDAPGMHSTTTSNVYKPVEGHATWQVAGSLGSTMEGGISCTIDGSGGYLLLEGDYSSIDPTVRDGHLVTWDDGTPRPLRFDGHGRHPRNATVTATMTCDGAAPVQVPPFDAGSWWSTGGSLQELFVDTDGALRGSYTTTDDSGTRTQTWEWVFVRVP